MLDKLRKVRLLASFGNRERMMPAHQSYIGTRLFNRLALFFEVLLEEARDFRDLRWRQEKPMRFAGDDFQS